MDLEHFKDLGSSVCLFSTLIFNKKKNLSHFQSYLAISSHFLQMYSNFQPFNNHSSFPLFDILPIARARLYYYTFLISNCDNYNNNKRVTGDIGNQLQKYLEYYFNKYYILITSKWNKGAIKNIHSSCLK